MSLEFFTRVTAIPEMFERLQADAEGLRGDLERLQRFVELCAVPEAPAPAPVRRGEVIHASALGEVRRGDPVVIYVSALGEESIEKIPSPPGGRSRAEMEAAAQDAAREMVRRMTQAIEKSQTAASGLAWAICVMRDASQGFQCPQTMYAIWKALDDMPSHQQAITEGQADG